MDAILSFLVGRLKLWYWTKLTLKTRIAYSSKTYWYRSFVFKFKAKSILIYWSGQIKLLFMVDLFRSRLFWDHCFDILFRFFSPNWRNIHVKWVCMRQGVVLTSVLGKWYIIYLKVLTGFLLIMINIQLIESKFHLLLFMFPFSFLHGPRPKWSTFWTMDTRECPLAVAWCCVTIITHVWLKVKCL